MKAGDPAVLIYDGECPVCQGGMRWVERRALPGRFEFLPCRSAERRARFPWMTDDTCLEAMQLVLPDGRVLAGAGAVPEILGRLSRWRRVAFLFRLPGAAFVAPRLYRWVARHRYRIAGTFSRARREV